MDFLRKLLAMWFLPWRQDYDPVARATSCVCSFTMFMSVGVIFSEDFVIPLLVGIGVFLPMIVWSTVRNTKDLAKSRLRMNRLLYADAVNAGRIRLDELPPHIQEDVRLEYARYKLEQEKP